MTREKEICLVTGCAGFVGSHLAERLLSMGHAVVGVDIDYEVLGADNGMLMVTASGTAVQIARTA